jgi:long-subunit acyl-CoA synthetase (AMP-forming)
MVYQIFNDEIEPEAASRRLKIERQQRPRSHSKSSAKSTWSTLAASLLITLIKLTLVVYDVLSFPIYFLLQRPDRRAKESQRARSRQVDENTWIRADDNHHQQQQQQQQNGFIDDLLNTIGIGSGNECKRPMQIKFMGATISEIFTQSIREFHSSPCLGYRAVVICPMLTQNEAGAHVIEEKSFRSDYTWYTYGQIGRRVQDIASGLYHHRVYPTSRAMFLAGACLEWFCTAHACFQLAVELVIVPDINDPTTLRSILAESEAQVLFVTCDRLEQLCKLIDAISVRANGHHRGQDPEPTRPILLRKIVVIDWQFSIDFSEDQFHPLGAAIENCPIRLDTLSIGQIEEAGIEHPIELRCSSAISEENLSLERFDELDRDDPTSKSTIGRYLNFRFALANGHRKAVMRRNVSGPNGAAAATGPPPGGRHSDSKALSAPIRRRHQNGERVVQPKGANTRDDGDGDDGSPASERMQDTTSGSEAPKPDDLAVLVYNYGSLGQLKPIMLTHRQLARCAGRMFLDGMIVGRDVHCAILPLDSLVEFMVEVCVLSRGGSIGYSCNLQTYFYDGAELFARDKSDLEALRPSYLLLRPYILERLRHSTQNYLRLQLNPIVSFLFENVVYDYKKYWARRHFRTPIVDRVFCSRLKRLFGDRLKFVLCNGATDCSETKDFFAFMVDLPVIELYGSDEASVSLMSAGGSVRDHGRPAGKRRDAEKCGYGWRLFQFELADSKGHHQEAGPDAAASDETEGHKDFQDIQLLPPTVNRNIYRENLSRNILMIASILCPTPGTRVRLEDWEEFRASDRPYPRGRLVLGGELVCKGYLNRAALSAETFYVDSNFVNWFRTGDIARAFPDGTFEIISAISNMIKMVDGQFLSLSQIEQLIRNSQFVDNVCAICGDDRALVINLVVPNLRRLALKSMGEAHLEMGMAMEPEPEELADVEFRREVCNDRLLCEFVSDHLNELLAGAGLSSITNRFLLVPEIWTPESELVTPAFEPKRAAIQKYYANDIRAIVGLELGCSTSRRLSARRHTRAKPRSSSWASI